MKRIQLVALTVALALAAGTFYLVQSSSEGTARTGDTEAEGPAKTESSSKTSTTNPDTDSSVSIAQAKTKEDDAKNDDEEAEDKTEEEAMSKETATAESDESEEFKQRVHEGDVALGVCGARISALLWFYEASVAQGRDDLKPAVESLTASRKIVKEEAERRAKEDQVDTSVRVMNDHSEKLWDELNKKAEGDSDEFQKAHDGLVKDVQECLNIFFERPEGAASEKKSDD